MTVNKDIKNQLDELEVGDMINELDYKIEDIDWSDYYISDIDFKTRWLDYGELFDELYENYIDNEQNNG